MMFKRITFPPKPAAPESLDPRKWILTELQLPVDYVIDNTRNAIERALKAKVVERDTDIKSFVYRAVGICNGWMSFDIRCERAFGINEASTDSIKETI